ncbi:MAG: GNAT family N-acetyltransferase [Anaerolineae bacterium]|nr:GNAT family N-acetyltransferase [Anaerolineae bacterium]
MQLRLYRQSDKQACLGLIDGNTPDFFAPHERAEFEAFLQDPGDRYWVAEDDSGTVVGCCGYWRIPGKPVAVITWTMVARSWQGHGVGRLLFQTCLDHVCRIPDLQTVTLETSQHVTGFYERVGGFRIVETVKDGFAPGLHKVVMRRERTEAWCDENARQRAAL